MVKFSKKRNQYENSTRSNKVSACKTMAWSYDHWQYLAVINEVQVFNNYHYSSSTSKHQAETRRFCGLYRDNVVWLRFTSQSLSSGIDALQDELNQVEKEIESLHEKINSPRTRKATNERRRREIQELITHALRVMSIDNRLTFKYGTTLERYVHGVDLGVVA